MAAHPAVEIAKRGAAFRAVDAYVRDGMMVGIGSGSTVVYAVERLRERSLLPDGDALRITSASEFVPTSFQSRQVTSDCTGIEADGRSRDEFGAPALGRGRPARVRAQQRPTAP